ncbi:MAG: 2-amino-4-hydroxy-6-hydroxymethyldihydropteridine diphosphokinase [Patescibacteria group bacterium]
MPVVYLSLGSNLGDRHASLQQAVDELKKLGSIEAMSDWYETEPVGNTEQPWFINGVIKLVTGIEPDQLLTKIHEIEMRLGRVRDTPWGPRTIDIDLLLYDNLVLNTDILTLPHPRLHERRFVLIPLTEIAPNLIHPVLRKSIRELLATTTDTSNVLKI